MTTKEKALDWWDNLDRDEYVEVFKKTGNYRLGGWGHDIGPTEDDVVAMYKEINGLIKENKEVKV